MTQGDLLQLAARLSWWQVALYFAVVNALAVLLYAVDKSAARTGGWRISEAKLQLIALLGGSPGALLAQRLFRHKTRKQPFQSVFRLIVVIQFSLLGWLLFAMASG